MGKAKFWFFLGVFILSAPFIGIWVFTSLPCGFDEIYKCDNVVWSLVLLAIPAVLIGLPMTLISLGALSPRLIDFVFSKFRK